MTSEQIISSVPEESIRAERRIISAPIVTINYLLGQDMAEHKDLTLGTVPIYPFRIKGGGDVQEYGAIVPYQLNGARLLRFLKTIAPGPSFDGKDGVLDDWRMPDLEGTYMQRLLKKHQSMGENWNRFEASRRTLIDTLDFDPRLQGRGTVDLLHFLEVDGHMVAGFIKEVAGAENIGEAKDFLADFLRGRSEYKNKKWVREGDTQEMMARINSPTWMGWSHQRTARSFIWHILADGSQSIKELVAEKLRTQMGSLELVDDKIFIQREQYLRGEIEFGSTSKGTNVWKIKPDSVVSTNYIIPVFHWIRDFRGERKWIFDFFDDSLVEYCQRFLEPTPEGLVFDSKRLNPLVGLGLVRYFSANRGERWPDYQAIKDGQAIPVPESEYVPGEGNFMGPAQVLVLVQQNTDSLLKDEIFDATEKHINSFAS